MKPLTIYTARLYFVGEDGFEHSLGSDPFLAKDHEEAVKAAVAYSENRAENLSDFPNYKKLTSMKVWVQNVHPFDFEDGRPISDKAPIFDWKFDVDTLENAVEDAIRKFNKRSGRVTDASRSG